MSSTTSNFVSDVAAALGPDEPTSTALHHRTIERAAKTVDILQPFAGAFDTFQLAAAPAGGATTLHSYCRWKAQMDARTLKWAFRLTEANVGPFYKENALGWHPKRKLADLNKNWARYLVLQDRGQKRPVAFAMFRFDMDYGCSVLYW